MRIRDQDTASTAQLEFVEEVALAFERQGLFRMAGRVIRWLLICEPPEQTFNQLAEALGTSKGSINAATRFLVPSGIVERLARPGERHDYYRVEPGVWIDLVRNQSRTYGELERLMDRGIDLLEGAPDERRGRLRDLRDFYGRLDREMPAMLGRWEREQGEGR